LRKFVIIFLVIQFLTNHEAFAEIVKMPYVFQHYSDSADSDNFIDFLKEHYTNDEHAHQDHEHGKLPFKHDNDGCSDHPSPGISPVIECKDQQSFRMHCSLLQKFAKSGESILSPFSGNIWQPPKLA